MGDAAADQHLDVFGTVIGVREAVPGRIHRQREGVFALPAHAPFPDASQTFEVDAWPMRTGVEQLLRREPTLGKLQADALDATREGAGALVGSP
jgi:hypothetical protein